MSSHMLKLVRSLSDAELRERAEAFELSGDREMWNWLVEEMIRRNAEAVEALG